MTMYDARKERLIQEYLGKKFMTKDGLEEIEIIAVRSYADVDIRFNPSGVIKNTKIGNIKAGRISSPFYNSKSKQISPICFDTPQHEYEGSVYSTNEGYRIIITKYESYEKVYYKFLDEFGYENCTTVQNIKKGQIRNPYHRNDVGGYLGVDLTYRNNEYDWLSNIWYLMLSRVAGKREQYAKNTLSYINVKAYENLTIDQNWYCYGIFANWYMYNIAQRNSYYEYQIDKDLLYPYYSQFTNGRKCYGPSTCVLIPKEINMAIANYYKCNKANFPEFFTKFKNLVDSIYENNGIDQDTYYILRRFYFKDPNYSNYITNKYNDMKYFLCGF